MRPSVVVTGWGAVTPLGLDAASSWEALVAGRDAAAPVALFDTEGCRCRVAAAAELPPLDLPAKALRRLPRASRLALPAAREALARAGLLDAVGRSRVAELPLSLSTTGGGMAFGEAFLAGLLARRRRGLLGEAARYQPAQQVLDLQEALGIFGSSFLLANACASGANALGHAADLIEGGEAECVLAGGFEALTPLIFHGFDSLQAASPGRCRPFDLGRDGLLLGEGAAFVVLESAAHAAARGAVPLARLAGYGHATDLHHLTQPRPDGAVLADAMARAARRAGVAPAAIGYVNAHGTATPANDGAETAAYQAFFGEALPGVRVSSTKAAVGHTLGAAGAIEALFALQALHSGTLPPQLNLREPIPEIAASLAVPGERRELEHVLSVNLGFGGSNAALLFSRA